MLPRSQKLTKCCVRSVSGSSRPSSRAGSLDLSLDASNGSTNGAHHNGYHAGIGGGHGGHSARHGGSLQTGYGGQQRAQQHVHGHHGGGAFGARGGAAGLGPGHAAHGRGPPQAPSATAYPDGRMNGHAGPGGPAFGKARPLVAPPMANGNYHAPGGGPAAAAHHRGQQPPRGVTLTHAHSSEDRQLGYGGAAPDRASSLPMPPLQTAQHHGGFDPSSHLHNGFHAGALRVPLADAISSLTAARLNGAGMSYSRVASAVGPPAVPGGVGAPPYQRHAEPVYMTPSPSKVCVSMLIVLA